MVRSALTFALYFAASISLLGIFLMAYVRLTRHAEFAAIRAGNTAAAISLGGATLGFALPVAEIARNSVGTTNS